MTTPLAITGRKIEITDALRAFIEEQVSSLDRFKSRMINIDVVLSLDGDKHVAEAKVNVRKGAEMVAQSGHDDMYGAVDLVFGKLERQLQKHKEKLKSHRFKKSDMAVFAADVDAAAAPVPEEQTYEDVVAEHDFEK